MQLTNYNTKNKFKKTIMNFQFFFLMDLRFFLMDLRFFRSDWTRTPY